MSLSNVYQLITSYWLLLFFKRSRLPMQEFVGNNIWRKLSQADQFDRIDKFNLN